MKKCQRAACGRGTLIISPDGAVGLAAGAHEDFAVPAVMARVSPKYIQLWPFMSYNWL